MNSRYALILMLAGLGGGVVPASGDVSIEFSTGRRPSHWRGYYRAADSYYRPTRRPYWVYPYHVRTVVVPQPVFDYPPPAMVEPPSYQAPALSGDYGQDLASLREKLSRLRAMVQRQKEKGGFTDAEYDRFMNALDGIEHDQRARAYDRGGTMGPEDFADLFRRLDETGADIERALAA